MGLPLTTLAVHGFLPTSRVNGPGRRAVVWVQGCTLACPGCFNPESHASEPAAGHVPVNELARRITALAPDLDGLTLSGGEPFERPEAVFELLDRVRATTDLDVLVFTGFAWDELQRRGLTDGLERRVDLLVAGRYVAARRVASGLLGSANKTVHALTDRIDPGSLGELPEAEVTIDREGRVTLTGIDPLHAGSLLA